MKDQTVRTGYIFSRFLTLVAHRKVFQLVDYKTGIIKGGFPLSRNFYVRTDVNFNWLYVRK